MYTPRRVDFPGGLSWRGRKTTIKLTHTCFNVWNERRKQVLASLALARSSYSPKPPSHPATVCTLTVPIHTQPHVTTAHWQPTCQSLTTEFFSAPSGREIKILYRTSTLPRQNSPLPTKVSKRGTRKHNTPIDFRIDRIFRDTIPRCLDPPQTPELRPSIATPRTGSSRQKRPLNPAPPPSRSGSFPLSPTRTDPRIAARGLPEIPQSWVSCAPTPPACLAAMSDTPLAPLQHAYGAPS